MSTTSPPPSTRSSESPHPKIVDGHEQKPIDGISLAYTFDDAGRRQAARRCSTSRTAPVGASTATAGIACAFGPFVPWDTPSTAKRLAEWDANTEPWELYHLDEDFSQANDLAAAHPDKLEELKALFKEVSRDNLVWPIGCGAVAAHPSRGPHRLAVHQMALRRVLHPDAGIQRTRAGTPGQPRRDLADRAGQRVRACSTRSAGSPAASRCSWTTARLVYEYNMLIIDRYQARSAASDPGGSARHHRRHRVRVSRTDGTGDR